MVAESPFDSFQGPQDIKRAQNLKYVGFMIRDWAAPIGMSELKKCICRIYTNLLKNAPFV